MPLRIATWNIGATANLRAVRKILEDRDVALAALQEVDFFSPRTLYAEPKAWTEGPSSCELCFFPTVAFANPTQRLPQSYGLGIATKFPIISAASYFLGPPHHGECSSETEPRALAAIKARVSADQSLIFATTHLAHTNHWESSAIREAQATSLAHVIQSIGEDLAIAIGGDFNVEIGHPDLASISTSFKATGPIPAPTYHDKITDQQMSIDFFLHRRCSLTPPEVEWFSAVSDHALVVTELRID